MISPQQAEVAQFLRETADRITANDSWCSGYTVDSFPTNIPDNGDRGMTIELTIYSGPLPSWVLENTG